MKNPQKMAVREALNKYQPADRDELRLADAVIFGAPVHFGNMCGEMKLFFDSLGPLWVEGALEGKPGACFCTNETLHCGKEGALLTMIPVLLAMGMIFVGLTGHTPHIARHGTYYGATATLTPTAEDLEVARNIGLRVAEVTAQLLKGRN